MASDPKFKDAARAMDEPPSTAIRRTFEAVAEHELRRSAILRTLAKSLKAYLYSCSKSQNVEWDRVAELIGGACRDFYNSLATSYLSVVPPINPEQLFGISGDLYGGTTLVDFENAIRDLKIQTPNHWPPPRLWRSDDSPEAHRSFVKLSKALHKDIRLGPYIEGGWLREWVAEGVRHWRPQFERRFAAREKPQRLEQDKGGTSQPPSPKAKRKPDPIVKRIKSRVRELRRHDLSHQEICNRLDDTERPPRATWRDLPWPIAYRRHPAAVSKWLSEAFR